MANELGEFRRAGKDVIHQVKFCLDGYLKLASADVSVNHLSEYVGPQMLGSFSRYVLDKYLAKVSTGDINSGHGYDEDPITQQVVKEIVNLTEARDAVIVPTGTAANLDLIASFVNSRNYKEALKLVACETEHTVVLEGEMLRKAGVKEGDLVLIPSRKNNGIIDPADLEATVGTLEGEFIFQMAIPSNEGVVPSLDQVKELISIVKNRKGLFLIDGARLANALVNWGEGLDILTKIGVDGFTLGTSKKGGLAEVVCISDEFAAKRLHDEAKAFGHISSKGSPLSLVTGIFLTTNLWQVEAESENRSATRFSEILSGIGIASEFAVGANSVFIKLTDKEKQELEANPNFGTVYSDYGSEKNITRVVFTGLQIPDRVLSAAAALAMAKKVPPAKFLSALTMEERVMIKTRDIETEYFK